MKIFEPSPFSGKWFSHKFRSAGLRYEIAVSIERGRLVWVNGPYPCGKFPDVCIFRHRMKIVLANNEKVLVHNGYPDSRCFKSSDVSHEYMDIHNEIRARHEAINRRLKQFNALPNVFRRSVGHHGYIFLAIANLTHMSMELGESLFEIGLH